VLYRGGKFYRVDGRSREGILLRDTNNALLEQLGRRPTPAERLLIERLSWLHLCITFMDRRVLDGTVDYHEAVQYSSHINSFSKGLANLGLLNRNLPALTPEGSQTQDDAQTSSESVSAASTAREARGDASLTPDANTSTRGTRLRLHEDHD
jgi:hypothetical protein